MKNKTKTTPFQRGLIIASCLLALVAGTASAAEYNLCAGETSWTMPDGAVVPVWSFGENVNGVCTFNDRVMTITVPDGDSGLTIHLTNNLPEPVSLHILGQALSNNGGPTFVDGRVMSFAHETAADGGTADYIWNDIGPGTHLLQSGTHPAKQVQMGLYAVVAKDAGPSEAYPGVSYTQTAVMVFHEIDPFIHDSVAAGTYAGSIHREASYFLINGAAYPDIPNPILSANVGDDILLRFVNAGLNTHVPQMLGGHMTLVARDAIPLAVPEERHGFEMPAGKTVDAIFTPEAEGPVDGKYPVYDAVLNLSNSGAYQGDPPGGGMLAYIGAGPAVNTAPVAADDAATTPLDSAVIVDILANDLDNENDPLTVAIDAEPTNGSTLINGDWTITYTPDAGFTGADSFTYIASDGQLNSNIATVSVTVTPVNNAPIALDDQFTTDEDISLAIFAPGLLANDSDGDGDSLTTDLIQDVSNGAITLNADGSFSYAPNPDFNGVDSFTYAANDGQTNGNTAAVTLTVNPVNDAPIAVDDTAVVQQDSAAVIDVLNNDSDVDGDALTAAIDTGPTNGTAVVNGDGTVAYTPNPGFTGTDSFTYIANDSFENSNVAVVTITVEALPANQPPVAVDDAATVAKNSSTPITIPVLNNDYDPDGAIAVGTVTVVSQSDSGDAVSVQTDGTVTYTPRNKFNKAVSFTYQVQDDQGAVSNLATVAIAIQ